MRYLITGVSSGVGRALVKKLVWEGNEVWGVARRLELLADLKSELDKGSGFYYTSMDVSSREGWVKLTRRLKHLSFIPEIIIFNAGILENDLEHGLESKITERLLSINFLGVIYGVECLLKIVKPGSQFIAISSSSALKGAGSEGVGYAASKAALSVAFESLYHKYKKRRIKFKLVFFGPIKGGMNPFMKPLPLATSLEAAVEKITRAVNGGAIHYYEPWFLFFFLRIIRILPARIYLKILGSIDRSVEKLKRT